MGKKAQVDNGMTWCSITIEELPREEVIKCRPNMGTKALQREKAIAEISLVVHGLKRNFVKGAQDGWVVNLTSTNGFSKYKRRRDTMLYCDQNGHPFVFVKTWDPEKITTVETVVYLLDYPQILK